MGDNKVAALFNANDGLTGRDGGPYLDLEEAREAEKRRARVENREPDLDNPPASAGIVLLTGRQVVSNLGVNNLPSQDDSWDVEDKALRAVAEDKDNNLRIYGEVDLTDQVDSATPTGDEESMQSILAEGSNTPDEDKGAAPKGAAPKTAKKTAAKKSTPAKKTAAKTAAKK